MELSELKTKIIDTFKGSAKDLEEVLQISLLTSMNI